MHLQENTVLNLTSGQRSQDFAQCPLYHVTYAPENFEVGTSNGLEEDAFTRKNIFDLGRMKYCLVSYSSRDVCKCKV